MQPNPYESPSLAVQKSQESRFQLRHWLVELVLIGEPIVLLVLATAHRGQMGSHAAYVQSPLIVLEAIGLAGAFLVCPTALIRVLIFLFQRRNKRAMVNGIILLLAGVLVGIAAQIDAATLIYAT
jgi:hypothetical protein